MGPDFRLTDLVELIVSGERGIIIGRVEYVNAPPSVLVRYKSGDGRATESWWTFDALRRIES